jgi:CMP-N,N'-diacetyllegionaminic acid synthase
LDKNVIAVIPAKSFSRRVPRKNMRPFNGRPLLYYTIDQALRSELLDEVYVSTDTPEIQKFAQDCGAKAPFLRPAELAADHVHGSVPILHMLEQLGGASKYTHCVQLLPSSPLKTAHTIDAVIRLSLERNCNVLSVTPTGRILAHFRTFDGEGRLQPVDKEVLYNFQTQDKPEVYCINGAVYCAPVKELLEHRTFHYGNPVGYRMNMLEAADIDTETDFVITEQLALLVEKGILQNG